MRKDGFLRFCDDPEIACCKAEKELEQLRAENASMREQLDESQRREQAAVEDLKLASDCSTCDVRGKKGFSSCAPLFVGDEGSCKNYEWRGPQNKKGEAE